MLHFQDCSWDFPTAYKKQQNRANLDKFIKAMKSHSNEMGHTDLWVSLSRKKFKEEGNFVFRSLRWETDGCYTIHIVIRAWKRIIVR